MRTDAILPFPSRKKKKKRTEIQEPKNHLQYLYLLSSNSFSTNDITGTYCTSQILILVSQPATPISSPTKQETHVTRVFQEKQITRARTRSLPLSLPHTTLKKQKQMSARTGTNCAFVSSRLNENKNLPTPVLADDFSANDMTGTYCTSQILYPSLTTMPISSPTTQQEKHVT